MKTTSAVLLALVLSLAATSGAWGDSSGDSGQGNRILLQGDTITLDGTNATVDGSIVTITAAGTFTVSGTLEDGQVRVDAGDKDTVRIILDGADLSSSTTAPIYVLNSDKTVISLADNSQNSVTDGSSYLQEDADSDEPNAAIFSKDDLTLNGGGSLTVTGRFNDGITSKDDLKITAGSITVNAVNDGIRGRDSVVMKGGALTIHAAGDGIQSNNDEDKEKGFVTIEDGTIRIVSGADGIQAESALTVNGGEISITAGGGSSNVTSTGSSDPRGMGPMQGSSAPDTDSTSLVSTKGLKANTSLVVTGGSLVIDTADDALHSDGDITLDGGSLTLASGDDAVHAEGTLSIDGGDIRITKCYEGLEAAEITLNGGTTHLVARDDGVNTVPADGSSGRDVSATSGDNPLFIKGGYLFVDSGGDGLDITGPISMSGGTVIVNGPTSDGDSPIDYLGDFSISGGLVLATGSSGMAMAASSSSTQPSMMLVYSATQPAGTLAHIESAGGEDVVTFSPSKMYESALFSSPGLVKGATYTVYSGGSSTGTLTDGLYSGGKYTPGTQVTGLTLSGVVTTYGSSGGMQGGMNGGPGGTPGGMAGNMTGFRPGSMPGTMNVTPPGNRPDNRNGTTPMNIPGGMQGGGTPPDGTIPADPATGTVPGGSTGTSTATFSGIYTLNGGSATIRDANYRSDTDDVSAVYVTNGGSLNLINPAVVTTGDTSSNDASSFYGLNAAVLANNGGKVTISGGSITTSGSGANGAFPSGTGSSITLSDATISATGKGGHGVMTSNGGSLYLTNVDIKTTGANGAPLATDRGGGTVVVKGGTVTSSGTDSPGIYSTGDMSVSGATIRATNAEAVVVEGANSVTLKDTIISGAKGSKDNGIMMYQSMSGDAETGTSSLVMTGGKYTWPSTTGPAFYVTNTKAVITLKGTEVASSSGTLLKAGAGSWGTSGSNGGMVTFTSDNVALSGSIVSDTISSITASLKNGTRYSGTINKAALTLDASSQWTVTGNSVLTSLEDTGGITGTSITNIIGNGYTVSYDQSLAANKVLAGKTYSLKNGGFLRPLVSTQVTVTPTTRVTPGRGPVPSATGTSAPGTTPPLQPGQDTPTPPSSSVVARPGYPGPGDGSGRTVLSVPGQGIGLPYRTYTFATEKLGGNAAAYSKLGSKVLVFG